MYMSMSMSCAHDMQGLYNNNSPLQPIDNPSAVVYYRGETSPVPAQVSPAKGRAMHLDA